MSITRIELVTTRLSGEHSTTELYAPIISSFIIYFSEIKMIKLVIHLLNHHVLKYKIIIKLYLEWLGSNQRMFVSKTNALPLGDIP